MASRAGGQTPTWPATVTGPKADPDDVARAALDALAADAHEVVVDEISKATLARLSGGVAALYPS